MPGATRHATNELETLGAQLHTALKRLWTAWRPVERGALDGHGLTPSQWTLLRLLCEGSRQEVPMRGLATGLQLTPSGVTRCAEPLVTRGLIERVLSPGDRRLCCLKPTAAGVALWQTSAGELAAQQGRLLERLAAPERRVVIRAVELLAAAAEAEAHTPAPAPHAGP